MFKKVLGIALLLVSIVGVIGCTSDTAQEAPASMTTVREANIGTQWHMKQIEINFKTETFITLELAAEDKVDGYFYIINGDGVNFTISGTSQIYASQNGVTSDRFSFTASQSQGVDYKLKFIISGIQNPEATIFLEIIYPVTGEVLVPIGTK